MTDVFGWKKKLIGIFSQAMWETGNPILNAYSHDMHSWRFLAVRLEGRDRLFIVPEDDCKEIENHYNIRIDCNKIRHMRGILEGRTDLEPDDPQAFMAMVHTMSGKDQGDHYVAREVHPFEFGFFINDRKHHSQERFMGQYGGIFNPSEKDVSYSFSKDLEEFRAAYRKGKGISYFMRGTSVSFRKRSRLAEYFEKTVRGTAITHESHSYSGTDYEIIFGHCDTETGLPEGRWTRKTSTTSSSVNSCDLPSPGFYTARYKNGVLLDGSLTGDRYSHRF